MSIGVCVNHTHMEDWQHRSYLTTDTPICWNDIFYMRRMFPGYTQIGMGDLWEQSSNILK